LDSNFATAITIGNTAVQLGNTVTTLNNMTLANVTISSGTITITNVAVTTANVSGTANISTLVVVGNATVGGNTTVGGNVTLSGGTANGVAYLNGSKVLTTGSALVFDGTNLGVGYSTINTTIAVNGNALFGTGAWPINDFGRSGSRFVNASSTDDGILVVSNMQSGVAANRGGYLYLGARATTGVDGATFATIAGLRENATSGNYSTALTFNTSTSAGALTERARFNSTGAFVFAGGSTGADGIGITFPATQSASSNANTLDDYEEGTWTATITNVVGTYTTTTVNYAQYTKIGQMVYGFLSVTVVISGTASDSMNFTLPFVPAREGSGTGRENVSSGDILVSRIITGGAGEGRLYKTSGAAAGAGAGTYVVSFMFLT
jgi:hypothetical protein